MIARHWLLFSVLVFLLGPVTTFCIGAYFHDHAIQYTHEVARDTTRTMRAETLKAIREAKAAHMAHIIIGRESNGYKKARSFDSDVHGHSYSYAQWKLPSWEEAKKRHKRPDYNFWSYEHQYELTRLALLANEGGMWSTCRRDPDCRDNFVREGRS